MASPPARQPLTDSGWFWAGVFSTAALLALVAIAPKFDVRQRQVESRFLGRRQAAIERQRRAAGLPETDLAEDARDRSEVAPGRIVPLWTLILLAGTATGGSWLMLARDRRRDDRHE
ncbi:MAG: hypothetical protein ACKO4T_14065 [Planctomycetaceae bacterium]